jgi:uncharacterized Rmd1/YagE family protein
MVNNCVIARRSKLDVARFVRHAYPDRLSSMKHGIAVVQIGDTPEESNTFVDVDNVNSMLKGDFGPLRCYAVIYPFGSVVFFNASAEQQRMCLQQARLFGMIPNRVPTAEDYRLVVNPIASEYCEFEPDHIVLRGLDINSIRVLSQVLGQTVAMEHYEKKVDIMLNQFRSLNAKLEERGVMSMQKSKLFKLIAANNAILTDMITQVKLLDRYALMVQCNI